jgi:hypothetical protein
MSEEKVKKSPGRPAKFDAGKMVELFNNGKTIEDISTTIGCSKAGVYAALTRNGIKIPKKAKKEKTEAVAV